MTVLLEHSRVAPLLDGWLGVARGRQCGSESIWFEGVSELNECSGRRKEIQLCDTQIVVIHSFHLPISLSSALDSVCVACPLSCPVPLSLLSSCCPEGWTHSRCFDFEYEIKFLMGISFGNRHFWFYYVCVLWPSSCWTIWSSANLIWVTHIHCTYAEGDGPCPIHIQSATTILNRVSWWWAILFQWYLILTIVILCPDLTLFNLTWHNKGNTFKFVFHNFIHFKIRKSSSVPKECSLLTSRSMQWVYSGIILL